MPFSELYGNISVRYVNYSKPYSYPGYSYVETGDIREYDPNRERSDIILVFGASSNHAVCLLSSILSFVLHFPYSSVVFADFGLTGMDICRLNKVYSIIHDHWLLIGANARVYNRVYNWDSFPDWMNMNATNYGGYTWKPIVIGDVFYQWKGVVLWNDASNLYRKTIIDSVAILRKEGIYVPQDFNPFEKSFHKQSYSFLLDHGLARPFNYSMRMGRANQMLFDFRSAVCRSIVKPWIQCAYTRKCMALIGVKKRIHLPEQGALSIIMMYYHRTSFMRSMNYPYVGHSSDVNSTVLSLLLQQYNAISNWNLSIHNSIMC